MSDLPGPEKPPAWATPAPAGESWTPDSLMAELRSVLGTSAIVKSEQTRPRANGAGGHGPYNGRSGKYAGKRVRDRHRIVVMLSVCGWKNNEIARATGYTESRVSVILQSRHPDLQSLREQTLERVANSTVDLTARIRLAAPKALDKMIELVESEDENVARLSARDILDRAGYAPVKKQINANVGIPHEELGEVLDKINEANEVVMERDNWVVKTLPRMSQRRDGAA